MTRFYTTKLYGDGITGIEGALAIGWPYHGVLRLAGPAGIYYPRWAIIGNEWVPDEFLNGLSRGDFRYPVEVANQSGDWSYFMLAASSSVGSIFIDGGEQEDGYYIAVGAPYVYLGATGLGIPAQTPEGKYLNFSACVSEAGDAIVVCTYPIGYPGRNPDTHPNVAHSIAIDVSSARSYTEKYTQSYYPPQMVPLNSEIADILFDSQILDYKKDRLLIGVYPRVDVDSQVDFDDTLEGRIVPRWLRTDLAGDSAYTRPEAGDQLIAIYEVVLTGETAHNVEVRQVKSPLECEGLVSRSSPSSVTRDGEYHQSYAWSISQSGAIIDAYYRDDSSIKFLTYDVEHSYSGWTDSYPTVDQTDRNYEDYSEIKSSITCGGVTKKYRQLLTREAEYPDGDLPFVNDNIVIRNRIWVDDEDNPTIDESFRSSENNNATVTPLNLRQLSDGRAPYPGLEARSAVVSAGFGIPAYHDVFNMHIYSLTLRNNGNGGCAFYGVIDTFGIHPDLINTKTVRDCHIFSKKGDLVIDGFTELVEFDAPRYGYPPRDSKRRGYVGPRLKTGINLHTGEFYEAPLDDPLARYYWV